MENVNDMEGKYTGDFLSLEQGRKGWRVKKSEKTIIMIKVKHPAGQFPTIEVEFPLSAPCVLPG